MRSVANQECQVAEDAFSKQSFELKLDTKRPLNDHRSPYYAKHSEVPCRSGLKNENKLLS